MFSNSKTLIWRFFSLCPTISDYARSCDPDDHVVFLLVRSSGNHHAHAHDGDFDGQSRLYGSRRTHDGTLDNCQHFGVYGQLYHLSNVCVSENVVGYLDGHVGAQVQSDEHSLSSVAFHVHCVHLWHVLQLSQFVLDEEDYSKNDSQIYRYGKVEVQEPC